MKELWLGNYGSYLNEREFDILEEVLSDDYGWHGVKSYFYSRSSNLVTDEEGFPVFDIYHIVTPSMFFLFTRKKEKVLIENERGELIELVWCE
jgi:hypothetical protein